MPHQNIRKSPVSRGSFGDLVSTAWASCALTTTKSGVPPRMYDRRHHRTSSLRECTAPKFCIFFWVLEHGVVGPVTQVHFVHRCTKYLPWENKRMLSQQIQPECALDIMDVTRCFEGLSPSQSSPTVERGVVANVEEPSTPHCTYDGYVAFPPHHATHLARSLSLQKFEPVYL